MVETIRTGEYSFLPAPLVPFSGGQGDLENRRKIALAMMSRKEKAYPKNVGEGIASLGESIGDVLYQKSLADAEKKFADKETGQRGGAPTEDYLPGATQAAVAGGDPKQAYAQDPRTDEDVVPLPRARPTEPVGGEETGLPMPATQPDMPNALTAALRTAPQRNQPGAPSTWGSGMLQQVPTDMASVAPGMFGTSPEELSRFVRSPDGQRLDRMQPPPNGQPLSQQMEAVRPQLMDVQGGQPDDGIVPGGISPPLTPEQIANRNNLVTALQRNLRNDPFTSPLSFNAASDQAAPTQDDQSAEKPELSTVGQGTRQEAPRGFPSVDNIMLGPEPGTPDRGSRVTGPASYGAQPAAAARDNAPIVAQGITTAPDLKPSQEPIPVTSAPMIPDPKPEPKRPDRLGPSKAMQYWAQFIDNPNSSPEMRAHALRQYNLGDQYRKELEARQQQDYIDQREAVQKHNLLVDELKRKEPERVLKERIDRLAIEEQQHKATLRPTELQQVQVNLEKSRADLEDALYKQGIPREQARVQADLAIAEARRKVVEPYRFSAGSTQFQQLYDPRTGTYGPAGVIPGAPPAEEKARTEADIKVNNFVDRATPEVRQLRASGNGIALTYFKDDVLAKRLPFGMDNKAVSEQYQKDRNAMTNFGTALMTYLSGASYGEKEMERTLSSYWPKYGDSDAEVARKAERREEIVRSVGRMTDRAGREYIAKSNFDYEATQPMVRVASPEEAKKLSPGRHFTTPDGRTLQVPFEEIRTR
jgi:hypothetical protein